MNATSSAFEKQTIEPVTVLVSRCHLRFSFTPAKRRLQPISASVMMDERSREPFTQGENSCIRSIPLRDVDIFSF